MENKSKIRNILEELSKNGGFPGDMGEERHVDRAYSFEKVGSKKVRFKIERHPHILGRSSLGWVC
jgi:hypothetical protein